MTNEILDDEQLDAIAGGTNDEAKIFRQTAVQKGWALSEFGMASSMVANKMLEAVGIAKVNWQTKNNEPAEFFDQNGTQYDFATVMEKIQRLPDKNKS